MRLKGKVAIVTGAGSGIGHATAALFAREGASVLVTDLVAERAKSVAAEIRKLGGVAEAIACDVSVETDAEKMVAQAEKLWHRVDILVNNAANFHHKTAEEATTDDWEKVLSVNVMGTSFCTRYAIPSMKRQKGGAIVNLASINGLVAMPTGWMTYSASKAAIVNMSKSMAMDLAPFNIRVNCVCPGVINTPALAEALASRGVTRQEAEVVDLGHRGMIKRFGEPYEVANVILMAASDEASYMTGATLVVDGGYSS
jgi:meso-butanediol dehydrogenase/(S,S)-butanediol dehydrogenase/diacetyl reductase